jgi:hypothetical protein
MTISERQRPLLDMFLKPGAVISIKQAQGLDQRPFRSFLVRKYIKYSPAKRGFVATEEFHMAVSRFYDTSIKRKDPTRPLTAYFDPLTYGLNVEPPKPRLVKREVKREGSVRAFIAHQQKAG